MKTPLPRIRHNYNVQRFVELVLTYLFNLLGKNETSMRGGGVKDIGGNNVA